MGNMFSVRPTKPIDRGRDSEPIDRGRDSEPIDRGRDSEPIDRGRDSEPIDRGRDFYQAKGKGKGKLGRDYSNYFGNDKDKGKGKAQFQMLSDDDAVQAVSARHFEGKGFRAQDTRQLAKLQTELSRLELILGVVLPESLDSCVHIPTLQSEVDKLRAQEHEKSEESRSFMEKRVVELQQQYTKLKAPLLNQVDNEMLEDLIISLQGQIESLDELLEDCERDSEGCPRKEKDKTKWEKRNELQRRLEASAATLTGTLHFKFTKPPNQIRPLDAYKTETFEESMWEHFYQLAYPPRNWDELWNCLFTVIEYFYRTSDLSVKKGCNSEPQKYAEEFVLKLVGSMADEYLTRIKANKFIHMNRLPKTFREGSSATSKSWLLELLRLWTLSTKDDRLQREWCGMLQHATRACDFTATYAAAQIWKAMSLLLVSVRGPKMGDEAVVRQCPRDLLQEYEVRGREQRPSEDENDPEEWFESSESEHDESKVGGKNAHAMETVATLPLRIVAMSAGVLWRGLRMHQSHVRWYQGKVNEFIRHPGATATTPDPSKALDFMVTHGYAFGHLHDEIEYVMLKFVMDPQLSPVCFHVASLDFLSQLEQETEYLFQPFSAFTVLGVQRLLLSDEQRTWLRQSKARVPRLGTMYTEIQLQVLQDNKTRKDGGQLDDSVCLARWM